MIDLSPLSEFFFVEPKDMRKTEGYLAWRFGLVAELPDDHPYKAAPPKIDDGAEKTEADARQRPFAV